MVIKLTYEERSMVMIYHHTCSNAKICKHYKLWVKRGEAEGMVLDKPIIQPEGGEYTCQATHGSSCERIVMLNLLERQLNLLEQIAKGLGVKK
jgi:hypothetical protein